MEMKDAIIVICIVILVPPSFTSQSGTISAEIGSQVTLTCAVSGDPHPTITWYYGHEPVPLDEDNEEKYQGLIQLLIKF